MRISRWDFDVKDVFLVLAAVLLVMALFFKWNVFLFDRTALLTLVILLLIMRGFISTVHVDAFFFIALTCVILTIFLPMLQVILFFTFSMAMLKLLRMM